MPLPFGQEGADATSWVARIAVAFEEDCAGAPVADVTAALTSRVSLFVVLSVAAVEELGTLEADPLSDAGCVEDSTDVLFDFVFAASLLSGQTTFGSYAFFEQQPLKPVDWQA